MKREAFYFVDFEIASSLRFLANILGVARKYGVNKMLFMPSRTITPHPYPLPQGERRKWIWISRGNKKGRVVVRAVQVRVE